MFNIGPQELLLILLVALVIVGPKRLPELSRTIGRGLREFRKAQDEVTKTIRLGLDDTEPTSKAPKPTASAAAGEATAAATPSDAEPAPAPEPDEAADIARTLGRGLAEIRRARQEIQRTFRVDLSDRPSPPARRPAPATASPAAAPATPASPQPSGDPPPAPGMSEPPVAEPAAVADGADQDATEPGTDG